MYMDVKISIRKKKKKKIVFFFFQSFIMIDRQACRYWSLLLSQLLKLSLTLCVSTSRDDQHSLFYIYISSSCLSIILDGLSQCIYLSSQLILLSIWRTIAIRFCGFCLSFSCCYHQWACLLRLSFFFLVAILTNIVRCCCCCYLVNCLFILVLFNLGRPFISFFPYYNPIDSYMHISSLSYRCLTIIYQETTRFAGFFSRRRRRNIS